jgi:hypothetical protein
MLLPTDNNNLRAARVELEARLGHLNLGLLDVNLGLANLHLRLLTVNDRLADADAASNLLLNRAPLRAVRLGLRAINDLLSATGLSALIAAIIEETETFVTLRHVIYTRPKIFSATFFTLASFGVNLFITST